MSHSFQVFVANPGSTSTKFALSSEGSPLVQESCPVKKLPGGVIDQLPAQLEAAEAFLSKHGVKHLDAAVGRGGLIRPVPSGTLRANAAMAEDARTGYQGE